ncbi:MAG: hypothetical protein JST58_14315 [Bacteroidetes bacterium]|nr:hypothetical protein [Bacteroidota bacterium]
MKTYKNILGICLLGVFFIGSCKKAENSAPPKSDLSLSSTQIKIGEPLLVTPSFLLPTGSSVKWSVSPKAINWTNVSGDSAYFIFLAGGSYRISTTYLSSSNAAYDSGSVFVNVTDSLYNDTVSARCNLIQALPMVSGDQISLQPISYSDTGLVLLAHTLSLYQFGPSLGYHIYAPDSSGVYNGGLGPITQYPCWNSNAPKPAVGTVTLTSLSEGTHPLVFEFNGAVYEGSFTVSATDCVFTWNYSMGITISPSTITKQ